MDREDRRRYFVIGSVIVEIVQPILRAKVQNEYSRTGYATLQDFLSSKPVLHTLYHLRHKGMKCCTDYVNCPRNHGPLPLNYYQWDLLYAENPGPANHHCHCKFTARSAQLDDLDISLSSLILLNCFGLSNNDVRSVENLRTLKNNYLSHNTKGAINEHEYSTIWTDLSMHVLQLDSTKQDDLIRIKQRPLDSDLCRRYNAELLGMHQKLDEIGSSISVVDENIREIKVGVADVRTNLQKIKTGLDKILNRSIVQQRSVGTSTDLSPLTSASVVNNNSKTRKMKKLIYKTKRSICQELIRELHANPYLFTSPLGTILTVLKSVIDPVIIAHRSLMDPSSNRQTVALIGSSTVHMCKLHDQHYRTQLFHTTINNHKQENFVV